MNMPSAAGMLVHQLTLDVPEVKSCRELCDMMNRQEFITAKQWYKRKDPHTRTTEWEDRGELIVNTHHIGKVAEWIEMEDYYDEPQGRTQFSRQYTAGPRGPIRPGRSGF